MNAQNLQQIAAGLFLFWLVLLLPWVVIAPLSAIVFDGGSTLAAYAFIFWTWTYPISVVLVWKYRDDRPTIALLPFLNIAAMVTVATFL